MSAKFDPELAAELSASVRRSFHPRTFPDSSRATALAMADQLEAACAEVARLNRLNAALAKQSGELDAVLVDNIEAARAEAEMMRPVVDAACELVDSWHDTKAEELGSGRLDAAVDAYRDAMAKDGK